MWAMGRDTVATTAFLACAAAGIHRRAWPGCWCCEGVAVFTGSHAPPSSGYAVRHHAGPRHRIVPTRASCTAPEESGSMPPQFDQLTTTLATTAPPRDPRRWPPPWRPSRGAPGARKRDAAANDDDHGSSTTGGSGARLAIAMTLGRARIGNAKANGKGRASGGGKRRPRCRAQRQDDLQAAIAAAAAGPPSPSVPAPGR